MTNDDLSNQSATPPTNSEAVRSSALLGDAAQEPRSDYNERSGLVERAELVATQAHAGQFRRDGKTPYIRHPQAVAEKLSREDAYTIATAWLHDALEDTAETEQSLRDAGIPEPVIEAVRLLTHRGEPYAEYLERIKSSDIARKVKIVDMIHNLSDVPTKRQAIKYARGLLLLLGGGGAELGDEQAPQTGGPRSPSVPLQLPPT